MTSRLICWGLKEEALTAIYEHCSPKETEIWSEPPATVPTVPIVIGLGAFEKYLAWAQEIEMREEDRHRPVLLFLSAGEDEPKDWEYYDGVIGFGDRDALIEALACTKVMQTELAATEVPASFLRDLKWPVSMINAAGFPFSREEWDAPNSDLRQHLAECATCRRAFNRTLENRLSVMGMEPVKIGRKAGVQIAEMLRQDSNKSWNTWLGVRIDAQQLLSVSSAERRREIAALALLRAMVRDRSVPNAEFVMIDRGSDDDLMETLQNFEGNENDTNRLLSKLRAELNFDFDEGNGFSIGLEGTNLIIFDAMGKEDNDFIEFRLELRRDGEPPLTFDSEKSRVSLPLEQLVEYLMQASDGEVEFLLLRP